ncbi:hypothetical protein CRG98_007559 [Punica granatum]|uniref:Uncharacterized protein n=1 Tax=Punica granatum TaxID=22663 RepID=A0A2I0KUJ3_PUNGR|nr:hypothetical protein CRG98_007559 [Punica granatum]
MGRSPLVADSSDGNAGGAERLRSAVPAVGRRNDGAKRSGWNPARQECKGGTRPDRNVKVGLGQAGMQRWDSIQQECKGETWPNWNTKIRISFHRGSHACALIVQFGGVHLPEGRMTDIRAKELPLLVFDPEVDDR